jgi:DNA-binding IclR family transcriptional regulator
MSDIGAINRVLKLVSLLADHPNVSAKDAAVLLGWPVSTTHRLLRRLVEQEFASQTRKGSFAPGAELFRIAGRLGGQEPYQRIAQPVLDALSARFRETSLITVLERRQLQMYIAMSAAPPDPMRYLIELNRASPLVWGASGRALLAFLTTNEIEQAIAACTVPNVMGEALDPGKLRAHLAQIATEGYSLTRSHRTLNSIGIAVPFFNAVGEPAGALGLQIPAFRFSEDALPDMVAALKEGAAVISQQIGARIDP